MPPATPIASSFQRLPVSTTPVALTPPTTGAPRYAFIIARTNDVVWQDDGTTVTATNGQLLAANGVLRYDGDLSAIRFIRSSADAVITVSYYSL